MKLLTNESPRNTFCDPSDAARHFKWLYSIPVSSRSCLAYKIWLTWHRHQANIRYECKLHVRNLNNSLQKRVWSATLTRHIFEYFPNNATLFMETTKSALNMQKGKLVLTTYTILCQSNKLSQGSKKFCNFKMFYYDFSSRGVNADSPSLSANHA